MAQTLDGDASALSAIAKPKAIHGHSMSDQQMAELYERMVASKSLKPAGIFPRGWNACVDFFVKQMRLVCDEPIEDAPADPVYEAMRELAE